MVSLPTLATGAMGTGGRGSSVASGLSFEWKCAKVTHGVRLVRESDTTCRKMEQMKQEDFRKRESAGSLLPVGIVLSPSWWHRHAGISFDSGFLYKPARRVEAEQMMEPVLHERFGRYGLYANGELRRPVIGAAHNAAHYLVSEMLGCETNYLEDSPPQVVRANRELCEINPDAAFSTPAFKRFERLCKSLKASYLEGHVNWSGVLNLALNLWGQGLFLEMLEGPELVRRYVKQIGQVLNRFTGGIAAETGTASVMVNRTVRHLKPAVFPHSACSLTMLSEDLYQDSLMPLHMLWSTKHRAFGIHLLRQRPTSFRRPLCPAAAAGIFGCGAGGRRGGPAGGAARDFFERSAQPGGGCPP